MATFDISISIIFSFFKRTCNLSCEINIEFVKYVNVVNHTAKGDMSLQHMNLLCDCRT